MHLMTIRPEDLFKALSDTTRLRIIRLLVTSDEAACLCEFVDALREPQYNLSRHLKLLRQSGLLSSKKEGRWVYHCLTREPQIVQRIYALVQTLADSDGIYKADSQNFKRRIALRDNGRCCVGIVSDELRV